MERREKEGEQKKYKKRKTAHQTGKENGVGTREKGRQAKTITHSHEAGNQVSKGAADTAEKGDMQTDVSRSKSNTTGRWRPKKEQEETRQEEGKRRTIKKTKSRKGGENRRKQKEHKMYKQKGNQWTKEEENETGRKPRRQIRPF